MLKFIARSISLVCFLPVLAPCLIAGLTLLAQTQNRSEVPENLQTQQEIEEVHSAFSSEAADVQNAEEQLAILKQNEEPEKSLVSHEPIQKQEAVCSTQDRGFFQSVFTPPAEKLEKKDILEDSLSRISDSFDIPPPLAQRVAFWFDVYSKYDSYQRVLHHRDYPWIVYDVIDTSPLYQNNKTRWLNDNKAERVVRARIHEIKKLLRQLVDKANYKELTHEQRALYEILSAIPGKRKKVFNQALLTIRSQTGQKDFYLKGLVAASTYFHNMETIFYSRGLPTELTRIPLVESSFNLHATSSVGASGVWQIMPNIGRSMMLVNDIVDERRSPIKSTKTAAKILRVNYKILKSWPLAITAYNHGVGSLQKIVKNVGSNNLEVIIEKNTSKAFQFASSNFFACFLAALYVEKYHDHIFSEIQLSENVQFEEVQLEKPMRVKSVPGHIRVAEADLKEFNPDIKKTAFQNNAVLPKGFKCYLPREKSTAMTDANRSSTTEI